MVKPIAIAVFGLFILTGCDDAVPPELRVAQIAAGGMHSCAILENGRVLCAGDNSFGQLGASEAEAYSSKPVQVQGLPGPAKAVAVGGEHTCALVNGGVWCWGSNRLKQLGLEGRHLPFCSKPILVKGLERDVDLIAAGGYHSCALKRGELYCWGSNSSFQLGFASDGNCDGVQCSPVAEAVFGLDGDVVDLALGEEHSCSLLRSGKVQCWGWNFWGQLGDSKLKEEFSERPVFAIENASRIAAGRDHTCALVEGEIACWGANHWQQLGGPVLTHGKTRVRLASPVLELSLGGDETCALRSGGVVTCWGGQLRRSPGSTGFSDSEGERLKVLQITAGDQHHCALLSNSTVQCWGNNSRGQLGTVRDEGCIDRFGRIFRCNWEPRLIEAPDLK